MRRPAWDNRKGEEKDMKNTMEIRWHGRGGQGAKTAALLLADVAFKTGKYVQGFPEYGPERMGAPITAYNRISEEPITIHSNIYNPDYVVVVDDGLLASIDVTMGLGKEGAVIVNSAAGRRLRSSFMRAASGEAFTQWMPERFPSVRWEGIIPTLLCLRQPWLCPA